MNKYLKSTASMDRRVKWVTTVSLIICSFAIILSVKGGSSSEYIEQIITYSVVALLSSLIPLLGYMYSVTGYTYKGNQLIIHRKVNNLVLCLDNLQSVQYVENLKPLRIAGSGGFFGFFGKFRMKNHGTVNFYITQKKNLILLTFSDNKKYLISPDNTEFFTVLLEGVKTVGR